MRDKRLYRVLCLLGCVVVLWSAAPLGTVQAQQGPVQYVVKRGDTLYGIAKAHGVTVEQLQAWNAISDPRQLKVGQTLVINPSAGDDPVRIAATPPVVTPVSTPPAASPPLITTLTAFGVIFVLLIAILSLFDRRRA